MQGFLKLLKIIEGAELQNFSSEYCFYLGYLCSQKQKLEKQTLTTILGLQSFSAQGNLQKPMELYLLSQLIAGKDISNIFEFIEMSCSEEIIYSVLDSHQQDAYSELYTYIYSTPSPSEEILMINDDIQPIKVNKISSDIIIIDSPFYLPDDSEYENYAYIQDLFQYNKIECLICMSEIKKDDYFPLKSCCDLYHVDCLREYLNLEITEKRVPIKCPKCEDIFQESDLRERLDNEMFGKYQKFLMDNLVMNNPDEFSCCPTPDCAYVFMPNGQSRFLCSLCNQDYCLNCRVNYHENITCEEFQKSFKESGYGESDKQFFSFVKGNKFKQCPNCKYWVEKNRGCNHMTCRCKHEFCYVCGAKHKTCNCNLFS